MERVVDSVAGDVTMESLGEPAKTKNATMPNDVLPPGSSASPSMKSIQLKEVAISGGELLGKEVDPGGDVDVQVQHSDDVDKQRLMWEAVEEERQVWDGIDEQHKLRKKEERKQKQEERRQKQEERRQKQEIKKKRRKELSNELDIYLQEATFPRNADFDILQWWGLHSSKYPILSQIARDILAVPASVVPSESAFSTGQRVVSDYRSRLNSTTVEALICLQDWFKHFDSLADTLDDNDL